MKIHALPLNLRPRERALETGVQSLSDRELLAIFIRKGTQKRSALEIADEILIHSKTLNGLRTLKRKDLVKISGIKDVKATEILALVEMSKRINQPPLKHVSVINDYNKVYDWLNATLGHEKQEHFSIICVDSQFQVIDYVHLFKGTLDHSLVHPRDVFREALDRNAAQLILVHNHPTGSMKFSNADYDVTRALVKLGNMMGIYVIDHIIVGGGNQQSMRTEFPDFFKKDLG